MKPLWDLSAIAARMPEARLEIKSAHTSSEDASDATLAILTRYFSAGAAHALLSLTRRREGLESMPLACAALTKTVSAIERALPAYLADPARRRDCMAELHRLLPNRAGETPQACEAVSRVVPVRTDDDLRTATDTGRDVCRAAGFSALDQTKVATAIMELTRNILQHAGQGEISISTLIGPKRGVEIVASDRGPGIAEVELVMSTRYRARGGMGMGLKGTKRIVDDLEITSHGGRGTTVTIRKYAL